MKILVFNAGSSSLKFELFSAAKSGLKSLFEGNFDNHGKEIKNFDELVRKIIKNPDEIGAVGHRVVHGGNFYSKPVEINAKVILAIKKSTALAPLHNSPNLAVILACKNMLPKTPQIAVFDTAFFQTMPEKAFLYGLPFSLSKKMHIRRYGFHGTSHQYVFEQARKRKGKAATRRTITCHLGNGCSVTAIKDGRAIDTSMGFTPTEGVPMGTRSGDIDPSIIFYLLKKGYSAAEIEKILNKKSGLLGVSEISSDMRDIWQKYKKGNAGARRALEWFVYRVAKQIGAYRAILGGLDCLVFTAGIGENADYVRKRILQYIDLPRNRVLVIPTNETLKIAQETAKFV